MVGADTFFVKHYTFLWIEDYYSKFPTVKKADDLAVDDLFKAVKIAFAEFGLPKKIISYAHINITSDTFSFAGR